MMRYELLDILGILILKILRGYLLGTNHTTQNSKLPKL